MIDMIRIKQLEAKLQRAKDKGDKAAIANLESQLKKVRSWA
jgi:hypothetical protein